ncbi:hypothetical protein [Tellurirhabdus bombi]|uniref:hypothetical protein n=1 Tax=Tellurirhabdus bombi TaxID=2907205 RepID=UPI001F2C6506|nr:hypothetical protein [Tellurirhabdus bombi]
MSNVFFILLGAGIAIVSLYGILANNLSKPKMYKNALFLGFVGNGFGALGAIAPNLNPYPIQCFVWGNALMAAGLFWSDFSKPATKEAKANRQRNLFYQLGALVLVLIVAGLGAFVETKDDDRVAQKQSTQSVIYLADVVKAQTTQLYALNNRMNATDAKVTQVTQDVGIILKEQQTIKEAIKSPAKKVVKTKPTRLRLPNVKPIAPPKYPPPPKLPEPKPEQKNRFWPWNWFGRGKIDSTDTYIVKDFD